MVTNIFVICIFFGIPKSCQRAIPRFHDLVLMIYSLRSSLQNLSKEANKDMVQENLILLFRLFWQPRAAMSEIMDRGNWFFGAILVTATAVLFAFTITNKIYYGYEMVPVTAPNVRTLNTLPVVLQQNNQGNLDEEENALPELRALRMPRFQRLPLPILGDNAWRVLSFNPTSMFVIALSLAVLYVPAVLLAVVLMARTSSYGVAMRRDYGALLSCTFFAWVASHLPVALLGVASDAVNLGAPVAFGLWLISNLAFGALMVIALMTACGATLVQAIVSVSLAWIVFRFDSWVISVLTFSPFFTLIWLVPLALGGFAGMRAAHLQRQSFRRSLEACAINEHDAEAQYQLGLLYLQRRQNEKAATHFRRAVEIDPKEPDANYQLGIIARNENRLTDAIQHFGIVVAHDDKYQQSEVWREIGATYLAAGMYDEAKTALEKFYQRRPYDPEGLYHFGETLSKLGETERAQEMYRQSIESVKTMPYYRRNQVAKWGKLAQAKL